MSSSVDPPIGLALQQTPSSELENSALRKIRWRLIPFLIALYFAAFIDRVSMSFAAPQMNRDLGFTDYTYGLAAGLFFIGYCLFEVPSNLLLHRLGARRWIAGIMVTWSVIAGAMAFVHGANQLYVLRFLLGIAEAGFFPGVVYYLTAWVPSNHRARLIGSFMTAIPISTAIGGPISSALLQLDGVLGVAGWRWLLLFETVPSLVLGLACRAYLRDAPADATWLTEEERLWLMARLDSQREPSSAVGEASALREPTLLDVLMNRTTLALGLCYFAVELCLYGVVFFAPLIFASIGVPATQLGWILLVPYGVAAAGMVVWSRASDRAGERAGHFAIAALLGFAGVAASAFLGHSPALAVGAITVGVLGTLAVLPIFWTLRPRTQGIAAAGTIALINSIGNIGGFAGPYAIGWIKSATGSYGLGLLTVATALLLAGIMALLIGEGSRHTALNAGHSPGGPQ